MQEPAYKELVLLYNVPNDDADDIPNLQLKIYGKIPIPDLKVCQNHTNKVNSLDSLNVDSHEHWVSQSFYLISLGFLRRINDVDNFGASCTSMISNILESIYALLTY